LHHCPKLEEIDEEKRLGIVHRLDRGTSGLIVAALNNASMRLQQEQLADRTVYKEYLVRLAEECGEVASQVGHFERKGVKTLKQGSPDRAAFAKELQDVMRAVVMRAVVQLAIHYELAASVDRS